MSNVQPDQQQDVPDELDVFDGATTDEKMYVVTMFRSGDGPYLSMVQDNGLKWPYNFTHLGLFAMQLNMEEINALMPLMDAMRWWFKPSSSI